MPVSCTEMIVESPDRSADSRHLPALRGELHGVGPEVDQRPLDLSPVDPDDEVVGHVVADQLHPTVGGDGLHGLGDGAQQVADGDLLGDGLQTADLDLVEHEEVLDEAAQPRGVAPDDVEGHVLPVRQVAEVAVDEQLEVAADRGQRGAQLVTDGRHEVGLLPVQLR